VAFYFLEIEEERWPDLATWIKQVWIEEGKENQIEDERS
jgi:hypothetical protein